MNLFIYSIFYKVQSSFYEIKIQFIIISIVFICSYLNNLLWSLLFHKKLSFHKSFPVYVKSSLFQNSIFLSSSHVFCLSWNISKLKATFKRLILAQCFQISFAVCFCSIREQKSFESIETKSNQFRVKVLGRMWFVQNDFKNTS